MTTTLRDEHFEVMGNLRQGRRTRPPGLLRALDLGRKSWIQYDLYEKYQCKAQRAKSLALRKKFSSRSRKHFGKAVDLLSRHADKLERLVVDIIGSIRVDMIRNVMATLDKWEERMTWD